ncbi:MAG: site-specific DNA-methyltransferase [Alphaproteobacteria bacterium]|nr:site-specific DNA-methyltransferase [Alphaproteobacteria bacterium]
MKGLPSESIDIIIADPPYNIGKNFGTNKDNLPLHEHLAWSEIWINEAIRVLKPGGTMYIYGFSEILARISSLLPIDNQRWLVWHYTNKNVPSLNFWQRSHESIIVYWKDKPLFNRDAVREPYTDAFLKNAAGKTRKSTKGRFSNGLKETMYTAHENGALPRDVISISTLAGGASLKERSIFCKTCDSLINPKLKKLHEEHELIIHPTQKPLKLTEKLILAARPHSAFSVLVPFAGSGTECLASAKLGADFIGFETNPDYQKLASALVAGTTASSS